MPDETELVAELKSGSSNAFDAIIDKFGDKLYSRALVLTGNPAAAEELTCDTFAASYTAIMRFRGDSALYSWLCSIQLNQFRYWCRKNRNKVSLDNMPGFDLPEEGEGDELLLAFKGILPALLQNLTDKHREVILLKYMEKLEISQIAIKLGIPEGTVKSRLHNAVDEMKKMVKQVNLLG